VPACPSAIRTGHLPGDRGLDLLFDHGVLYRCQQVFRLREQSMSTTSAPSTAPTQTAAPTRRLRPRRNPWRHPWFLEGFTWLCRQFEEASADLGANRFQTMRRVMLPLRAPAIFASAVLVFSGVIDDFVIVDLLSSNAGNTPMSVIIYSTQHGGNGGPALNALGTIMLVMSFVIAIIGYIGYRFLTRGERGSRIDALTTIAGTEG